MAHHAPIALPYTHDTRHFTFHYIYTSDAAARTDPRYDADKRVNARHGAANFAYVENYATYFEASWHHYFEGLIRYRVPPGVSASERYHVYVYDVGSGAYGVTYTELILPGGRATSSIAVRNHYRGLGDNDDPNKEQGAMKVTAAHEFFHAIQFGHPIGGDWDWWMEASATFMEDEVFDAVNDYSNYLDDWFKTPEVPLDQEGDNREYGSMIFCKYLSERLGGPAVMRATLRRARRPSAVEAIDGTLRAANPRHRIASGRYADAFSSGFAVSNLLRDDPDLGYEEGRRYPDIHIAHTLSSYPVATRTVSLDHLSAAYIRLRPPAATRTLHLAAGVEGSRRTDPPARVLAAARAPNGSVSVHAMALRRERGGVFGGLEINGFGRTGAVREVTVIIANTTWGDRAIDTLDVSYAARLE
jgi:hypothetical protein